MDTHLRCLYNYITENKSIASRESLTTYRHCLAKSDAAYQKMEKSLTAEQLGFVEDYLEARSVLSSMETGRIFEEAVALGKWMAH